MFSVLLDGWILGSQAEETIEGVVGKIDPRLPEAIQALKRVMRLKGNPYNSEKAYVGKVNAFMKDFGLQTFADFGDIGEAEVEAHLTDLASAKFWLGRMFGSLVPWIGWICLQ